MKRDRITIDGNVVAITGKDVWMTQWEMAELFNTTIPRIRAALKTVFEDRALAEHLHRRRIRLGRGMWGDVYSVEVIVAMSFKVDTYNANLFRKWAMRKLLQGNPRPPCVVFSINGYRVHD